MMPAASWSAWPLIGLVSSHLWQSTLFAAIAGLVTLALRRNRAQVRYALWLAASAKFLIPFAPLVMIGGRFGSAPARIVPFDGTFVVEMMNQPFPGAAPRLARAMPWSSAHPAVVQALPFVMLAVWAIVCALILVRWFARWRAVATSLRAATGIESGPELDALRRLEKARGLRRQLRLVALPVSAPASLEPGVFGILKPALLWPRNISEHLGDEEIEAIIAHEVSHVRRHDNLAAACHMIVQALFWFHPLVWWMGSRLVDERERACDQEVVRLGGQPEVYAESILKACRLYVETPLACVAGVTGSNLKQRIEGIMNGRLPETLSTSRRLLLMTVAVASLGIPIVIGAAGAPRPRARSAQAGAAGPTFEVASVKPNKSGDNRVMMQIQPGGRFNATNVTLRMLIRNAYQLQDSQISGGPGWLTSDHFDIVAKAESDAGDPFQAEKTGEPSRGQLMLRALLAERFKLEVHNEQKEMPIYGLLLARSDGKLGPQIERSEIDCAAAVAAARGRGPGAPPPPGPPQPGDRLQCGIRVGPGSMTVGGTSMKQLANSLSMFVGRTVRDQTGLTGNFDFNLTWTPDQMPQRAPGTPPDQPIRVNGADIDPNGPSIFTALREQLGLKLDSQRGPVDVLVIDRAEHPTEN